MAIIDLPRKDPFEKFLETDNLSYLYSPTWFDVAFLVAYFSVLIILAIYGMHRYYMVYLYYKHKNNKFEPKGRLERLPIVTVQLPIYNEMYVVERLIESVCNLDYPRELLEIQVLDDSTDETQQIARDCVERYKRLGYDIKYLHRDKRTGYKAGALAEGLKLAKGEFVAIFDADFMPQPETLQRTIHYFSDPKVGMVQIRWGHINSDYSFLTRVQAIMLDGHFIIEHTARNRSGRFFNFNGTAGVWRKEAIMDAGGWEQDTLTEDLDLSYRAQLKGWQFIFIPELVAPAEIPVDINSFKSQQNRWAKGSMQTCKKILPRVLKSNLPAHIKLEAFFHLTANISYPLMVLLSLLLFPAMIIRFYQGWFHLLLFDLPLFTSATLSVSSFYIASQKELYPDWVSRIKYLPFLMAIGIGLSVSNSKAVLEGLFGVNSSFSRTPKFCIEKSSDLWHNKKYRAKVGIFPLFELALGIYFTYVIFYALSNGLYGPVPFLILFQVGYLYTGSMSIVQDLRKVIWAVPKREHSV